MLDYTEKQNKQHSCHQLERERFTLMNLFFPHGISHFLKNGNQHDLFSLESRHAMTQDLGANVVMSTHH